MRARREREDGGHRRSSAGGRAGERWREDGARWRSVVVSSARPREDVGDRVRSVRKRNNMFIGELKGDAIKC